MEEIVPDKRDLMDGPLRLATCASCHARYQPVAPDAEALARHYAYMATHSENVELSALNRRRLIRFLAPLSAYRSSGRLLEVGCGGGLLLEVAREEGWRTYGTEISPTCSALLKPRMGDRFFQGELSQTPFAAGSFDVVIMMEVIEHLVDPSTYLRAAHRLLRPGGALAVTTPNIAGFSGRVWKSRWRVVADEHLNYFDRSSLSVLLDRCGFGGARISTTSVDLNMFDPIRRLVRGRSRDVADPSALPTAVAAAPRSGTLQAVAVDSGMEIVNSFLRMARLGDSLKAVAERSDAG